MLIHFPMHIPKLRINPFSQWVQEKNLHNKQSHRLSMTIYQINEGSYKEHNLRLYSLNTKWCNQAVDIEAGLESVSMKDQ